MANLFTESDWSSVRRAVMQEIEQARRGAKTLWLDIDGIEHVQQVTGRYIYRLLLSQPVHLEPEQTISFTSRDKEKIRATVVASSDNELVVDCESPLPDDARLQQVETDPSFIYEALLDFLSVKKEFAGEHPLAVVRRELPAPDIRNPVLPTFDRLNDEQRYAIGAMHADKVHLLWGPPGTGKTTTIGASMAQWMREGKSVLLVSTSNAAVDVAVKSLLNRLSASERRHVLRLGASTDKEIANLTLGGKFSQLHRDQSAEVVRAQERMRQITELIAMKSNGPDELARLFEEHRTLQPIIARFNEQVVAATDSLASDSRVFACTLARMTLDKTLRARQYDVVVVDEASMVSILYALAAATLCTQHLVYAGDPKQLPPIVQSDQDDAKRWFGRNIFSWLSITEASLNANLPMTLLRTQYRMTDQIGQIVSRLSYGGSLIHGRKATGIKAMLVDIPGPWQTRLWSVRERSYYQPATIPLLHTLIGSLGGQQKEMLLLTPFRAQQSLLSALAFDLTTAYPEWNIRSSTIHRSQGSERYTVIVDLTTHSPKELSAFFEDETGELLFNVAISRAANCLVILASKEMLQAVAEHRPFWKKVITEMANECDTYSVDELIDGPIRHSSLKSIIQSLAEGAGSPAICCCQAARPSTEEIEALRQIKASRKLLIAMETAHLDGQFIMRAPSAACPPLFVAQGHVAIPYGSDWLVVPSPAVSRVIWRVGFSHLCDEEVNPNEARRFFCPKCVPGNLQLHKTGAGWMLTCSEFPQHCTYSRHPSLDDVKAMVRLAGLTCSHGHPLTARSGPNGIFLGCENYPRCDFSSNLSILAKM